MVVIFCTIIADLRRAWVKRPHLRETIIQILNHDHEQNRPGTKAREDGESIPMSRSRTVQHGWWRWKPRITGPTALAQQSAALHNAATNQEMMVCSWYTEHFHIVNAPWQYIQKAIQLLCEGAAFHVIAFNRKALQRNPRG